MSAFRAPEKIDLSQLDDDFLTVWLQAFDDYKRFAKPFTAEELKKDPSLDVSLFLHLAGLQVRSLASNLTHDGTLTGLVDAIRKYKCPVTNVVVERNKFFSLVQESDEDLPQFLIRLKRQASKCSFSDATVDSIENQMIRDQMIKGVRNADVRVELLRGAKLTLKRAEAIAASIIFAEDSSKVFQDEGKVLSLNSASFSVGSEGAKQSALQTSRDSRQNRSTTPSNQKATCWTCQKPGHYSKDCFRNHVCEKCNRIGHFERFCRFARSRPGTSRSKDQERKGVSLTVSDFASTDLSSELCFLNCEVNDIPCRLLVDTGATINLVSKKFVIANDLSRLLEPCTFTGKVANGSMMHFRSLINVTFAYKDVVLQEIFYVAECLDFDGLLGLKCLKRMGLHLEAPGEILFTLQNSLTIKYKDVFDKPLKDAALKRVQPKPVIRLEPDAQPKQCKVRALSKKDKPFVDKKIAELLEAGVIQKSMSPWRHQPLVVPKDGGDGKRLVIDYKPVNSLTVFDAFPLPDINSIFEEIGSSKLFSKIDFTQFYHQLPLLPEDVPKTAFHYDGQLYEYLRCPFGLKNAVSYCFRVMKEVLKDCTGVAIYLDDLCVHGRTRDEHDRNLQKVLAAIREHGLSVNSSKCDFSKEEISFLGFIFRDGVRRPDPKRYSALRDFSLPTDAKQLQRFIGMCSFFSNFVPYYIDLITPLYSKLKSFSPWSKEETYCFDTLKRSIFDSSLLIPGPDEPLVLYTDASDIAISGVLVTGTGRPVQFCSRKLSPAEAKYDIIEREALAIFWSVTRCRTFLLGRPFVVYSDHKGLQFLFKDEKASPKVLRWRLNLADYNLVVRYYRGSENLAADCFSRINNVTDCQESIALDEGKLLKSQQICPETKAFLLALKRGYMKRPNAVSAALWSCRKDACIDEGMLKINNKIFVPYSMRRKCLMLAHGCHAGQDATYNRLKENLFWPSMKSAVTNFVQTCRICSMTRPRFYDPPMTPIMTQSPMQCLAADYIGPLPVSHGYKYALVIIDVYSRFPFVFPVKTLRASELCSTFKKVFALCGYPDAILTDRGSNFESSEFVSFCSQRNIRKMRTTSYNPKGNGICERFNKTLKQKIFSTLSDKCFEKSDWILCVDEVLFDYRTSVHATTEFRPVDLFYSFNCRGLLPFSCQNNPAVALEKMQGNRERAKQVYDKKASTRSSTFQEGKEALLKLPSSRTFAPKVIRVRVLQDVSPENAKVLFPSGRTDIVSKSRLGRLCVDWDSGSCGGSESLSLFPGFPTQQLETATDSEPEDALPAPAADGTSSTTPAIGRPRPTPPAGRTSPMLRRGERRRYPPLRYDSSDWRDPALL